VGEIAQVPPTILDQVADAYVRQVSRQGAITGLSFGLGGILSVAPELMVLIVTLVRMAQRLSLTYGHEFDTPRGGLDLWTSIGRSLGISIDLEGLDSELYRGLPMLVGRGQFRDPLLLKVAQRVIVTVAVKMSTRAARLIPFLGAGVGSLTNYTWLSRVGTRLKDDFRTRHQLRHLNLSDPGQSEEISFTLENPRG
jgi:hypothetical protein